MSDVSVAFPKPWRVAVNPFGHSDPSDTDNVFVLDAEGSPVVIIAKHPVWLHKEQQRISLAEQIVRLANQSGAAP